MKAVLLCVVLLVGGAFAASNDATNEGILDDLFASFNAFISNPPPPPVGAAPPATPLPGTPPKMCSGKREVFSKAEGSFTWNNYQNPTALSKNPVYLANMDHCYVVQAQPGKKVVLKFVGVQIQTGYDFLEVYEIKNAKATLLSNSPGASSEFSSDAQVMIRLRTDATTQQRGFLAQYTQAGATTNPTNPTDTGSGLFVNYAAENHKAHRTEVFAAGFQGPLFVRRGAPFKLAVAGQSPTSFTFSTTVNGRAVNTEITCNGQSSNALNLACTAGSDKTLQFTFGAVAPIGRYTVKYAGQRSGIVPLQLFVLANPFAAADTVHMSDANEAAFYSTKSTGHVFTGDSPKPWDFALGDPQTIHTAFDAIEALDLKARMQPLKVMREISFFVGNRVLWGRWDGAYEDGVAPGVWQGSGPIFKKYQETKQQVQYGQCWVFSALTVSVSRALGIPCRSVTNIDSSHEKGLDKAPRYSKQQKPFFDGVCNTFWKKDPNSNSYTRDKALTRDSTWNFHVWNESPFNKKMYAYDATPQEFSAGRYQCGPASINQIYKAFSMNEKAKTSNTAPGFSELGPDNIPGLKGVQWLLDSPEPDTFDAAFIGGEVFCQQHNFDSDTKKGVQFNGLNGPRRQCSAGSRSLTEHPTLRTADVSNCYKNEVQSDCPANAARRQACPWLKSQARPEGAALIEVAAAEETPLRDDLASLLELVEDEEYRQVASGFYRFISVEHAPTTQFKESLPPSAVNVNGVGKIKVGVQLPAGTHTKVLVTLRAMNDKGLCLNQKGGKAEPNGARTVVQPCTTLWKQTFPASGAWSTVLPLKFFSDYLPKTKFFEVELSANMGKINMMVSKDFRVLTPALGVSATTMQSGAVGKTFITIKNDMPYDIPAGGYVRVKVPGISVTKEAVKQSIRKGATVKIPVEIKASGPLGHTKNIEKSITAKFVEPKTNTLMSGTAKLTLTPSKRPVVTKCVPRQSQGGFKCSAASGNGPAGRPPVAPVGGRRPTPPTRPAGRPTAGRANTGRANTRRTGRPLNPPSNGNSAESEIRSLLGM